MSTVTDKIESAYPGAETSSALAAKLENILSKYGYEKSTSLLSTSFCSDEVNCELENDLRENSGANFSMGNLAGSLSVFHILLCHGTPHPDRYFMCCCLCPPHWHL